MKKLFYSTVVVLSVSFIAMSFSSCKKSEPAAASAFNWTFNGGTATKANIHKAFSISKNILATKGSNIVSFDILISVSSFNTGSYTITSGGSNSVLYIDNSGNNYTASAGVINITSYSSNLISGNFNVTLTDTGGSYTLSGSFTDTPVEF